MIAKQSFARAPWIFGYGRRSTDKQSMSLDQQRDLVMRAIDLHRAIPNRFPAGTEFREFIQETHTRADPFTSRPCGSLLATILQPGDYLYVAAFDRLIGCRKDIEAFEWLVNSRKVNVVMLDCGIDTSTDLGMFALSILALVKDLERKTIAARTRRAAEYRRSKGLPAGRPAIGWRIRRRIVDGKKECRYVPSEEDRKVGNWILEMREKALWPIPKIALELQKKADPNYIHPRDHDCLLWLNPRTKRPFHERSVERYWKAARENYPLNSKMHVPDLPEIPPPASAAFRVSPQSVPVAPAAPSGSS